MTTGAWPDISAGLKNVYPSAAVEAMVNEEAPFRRWLKRDLPAGNRVREGIVKFAANFSPPQNVGQHVDADNLVTPKDRTQAQMTLNSTLFSGAFQIGWQTIAAANSDKSAFNGGEVRRRTEETVSDLAKYIEQTYVGTEGTGLRARVLSDGSNTFVAAQPLGVRLLRENHYISVRNATAGSDTVRDSCDFRYITKIDQSTRTVTYSGNDQTLVANDPVHVVTKASQTDLSSVASATQGVSANGLRGLVDDATYAAYIMGLARATYIKLNSVVKGNGGTKRNLSEQILVNAVHEVRHRVGKRITDMWANTGQAEKYIQFVAPDRRYPQNGGGITEMSTGYQEETLVHYAPGVRLNLNISVDVVPRELYLLNRDTFFHYVARNMDWWDEGSMLKPVPVSGGFKAAYFAAICSIENIGCIMPLANCVVRDLNDPLCGDS